ncbi:MAG: DNA gyrase inhibitor YacG [Legionellales bacterium]|nr:DNA gyrase inhibitor YacG [Legionellales bacterium]|tara:strand:- start:1707 stop:1910 length:204 start_codon:yes stop_codon:yes gene_type:complete
MTDNSTSKNNPYQCPRCQKTLNWSSENEFRPFCSSLCQKIDFGNWANEEYAIPSDDKPTSLDEEDFN